MPSQTEHEHVNKKENEETKTGDSSAPEAPAADNQKKQRILDTHTISVSEPEPEASTADNVKEMDIHDSSETVRVTESAPAAARCQSEEPLATDPTVKETTEELVKESAETSEEKQPKIDNIPVAAVETSETSINSVDVNPRIESKTSLVVEGTGNSGTCSRAELENESSEKGQEEQLKPVPIYDPSDETVKEKSREPELDADIVKETGNYEAQFPEPEATKKPVKTVEKEQLKADISENAAESIDKVSDIADHHPPKDSDTEVAKETGKLKAEKPEVEEKPREKSEVAEEVEEKSRDLETKGELVSKKEEKDQKEEEIIVIESSEQVSLKEEAHEAVQNGVEISAGIAEKLVEEGDKKEQSCTHVVEVPAILENPEQVSINQEALADLEENTRDSTPSSVEENIVANEDKKEENAADLVEELSTDLEVEMKRVEESNEAKTYKTEERIAKVESLKDDNKKDKSEETMVDEEKETLASKLEEKGHESIQTGVENLEKQQSVVDGNKDGHTDNKEDEVTAAVSEPIRIRETLASKLKEKEEESIKTGVDSSEKQEDEGTVKAEAQKLEPGKKEGDTIKTSKDLRKETPAKPGQKQSNNIISKVKQSLVKAKKAITGKSPSSKTISTEAKGNIEVK